MISFVESIISTFNEKNPTDIIYFDFAKAFDSVNHDLILYKLKKNFDIDGRLLKFFVNYLFDRKQQVVLENEFSDIASVISGVPKVLFWVPYCLCSLSMTFITVLTLKQI